MANIAAAASGGFSAPATWVGGVVPGSGDVAFSNTFTVTISDTRTVQAISNASGTGIAAGGTFQLLDASSLTCTNANGVVQGATASSCLTANLPLGTSATVTANVAHTINSTSASISFGTSGTLNVIGNLTGSTGNNDAPALTVSGLATVNITGNLFGGTRANTPALSVQGSNTVNITGNITGGTNVGAIITSSAAVAAITVTGNVTGGPGGSGVINNGGSTITVNGICQSSSVSPAINAGSPAQITRLSGPFLLGASGNINPVIAVSWRWAPTLVPTYMEVATSSGSTKRNLYSADNMPSGGYPTAGHVRQSTIYGPSSELTGTLAVPPPSSVALGVATDNTTGTAVLTAANVRSAMGLASANLDTQLANKATVDQVASIVQGATSA